MSESTALKLYAVSLYIVQFNPAFLARFSYLIAAPPKTVNHKNEYKHGSVKVYRIKSLIDLPRLTLATNIPTNGDQLIHHPPVKKKQKYYFHFFGQKPVRIKISIQSSLSFNFPFLERK